MGTYILKRLLIVPFMILGITIISFSIVVLAPGTSGSSSGAGELSAGARLTQQQEKILRETFHVGKPLHIRYGYWLWDVLHGDFGRSVSSPTVTVAERLWEALPRTILLNLIVIFVLYVTSIPVGIHSAARRNSFLDRSSTVIFFILYSLPSFWVSILMIKLMVSLPEAYRLPLQGLFPDGAEDMDTLTFLYESSKHLILPVIAMSYAGIAVLSRFMRVGMLDIIRSDYIRTARAKGCPESTVILKHALRNSLIPMITLVGGLLPTLIGGSVIIETIFGIQGMGNLSYTAVLERDYTILMSTLSISAVLTLVGFLVSDIMYVLVDPRISFEKEAG